VQNPNSAPQLESLSLSASQAASGSSVQGTVFLSIPAGSGGVTVALSSNSTAASVPSSVTIPAGSTSASFTVSAGTVGSNQAVTITAAYNGSSAQATLTVTPAAAAAFSSLLSTLTFQPTGNPSSQFTLQVTPQAGNATYTAAIEGLPFFVNGTASNQNQTFTFTTLYSNAVTTSPAFMFNGSLLRVSSASLSFTLTVSPAESGGGIANGSLSGTFSVTDTPVLGGATVTASGAIGGIYTATQ
jgi:trimeric autotransporter adhesin